MTDFDVRGNRATTIPVAVTVTNPDGSPIDLTAIGTKLVFTGKLTEADPQPLFQKTYQQGLASPDIAISGAAHNVATVSIRPADTATLTKTSYILCDAVLTDPASNITTVARGVVKVRVGVGT